MPLKRSLKSANALKAALEGRYANLLTVTELLHSVLYPQLFQVGSRRHPYVKFELSKDLATR